TARPDHCDILSDEWPEFFNRGELAELQYTSMQSGAQASTLTIGAEVWTTPETVYKACRSATLDEPVARVNRVLRLVDFHIDRHSVDPVGGTPLFDEQTRGASLAFRDSVIERAAQGWGIQIVLSASTTKRLTTVKAIVDDIEGPNVEIFGYPQALPLVLAPVVVANRDVLIVFDHRRWERPGSAVVMRSRDVVAWANRYFDELIADAPYRLRTPAGIEIDEFAYFCAEIEGLPERRPAGASRFAIRDW
ncbi:MAG: hypothetical protein ACC652_15625, partial [Acidimicrobiales bacterium]